ncbi:MAG: hypothetical protein JO100_04005 [Pseudonocardia sp.]|nr:hypothetical protein [Pseudonocardia sp.]
MLAVALVVALGVALGLAGLRLAQLRSVPMAVSRAVPAQGSGSSVVELSADTWAYSSAQAVQDLFQRYFDAINTKNYDAWETTVVPALVAQQPEASWHQAYGSTVDGTIRISRIDERSPGRLVALVSFISTQRADSATDDLKAGRICWREAFALTGEPPVIDVVRNRSVLRGSC